MPSGTPEHQAPPFVGTVHMRVRVARPFPQVTEQETHIPHSCHTPLTEISQFISANQMYTNAWLMLDVVLIYYTTLYVCLCDGHTQFSFYHYYLPNDKLKTVCCDRMSPTSTRLFITSRGFLARSNGQTRLSPVLGLRTWPRTHLTTPATCHSAASPHTPAAIDTIN